MWPKFGNSSIYMREDIITLILYGFDQKNHFFWERSQFKFNNLGLALGMALKFHTSEEKGLKLKARKFWGLTPVSRSYRRKTGRGWGLFEPFSILNWVKTSNKPMYI